MRFSALTLLFLGPSLFAQQPAPNVLTTRGGSMTLAAPREGSHDLLLAPGERRSGRVYRFLGFDHTLNAEERAMLIADGVRFLAPIRPHGWSVSLPGNIDQRALTSRGLTGIRIPTPADKLDPALTAALTGEGWLQRSNLVVVTPWTDRGPDGLASVELLQRRPFEPIGHEGARLLQLTGREIEKLLVETEVQWIEPAPVEGEPEDVRGQTFHRVNALPSMVGANGVLDGDGVTVVVNDDGFAGPHIDFTGRTEQATVAQDLTGTHGDMVAGIVGGAGNLDPRNPGMAPGSRIIMRQYQGNLPNTVQLYQNEGAVIFNSSYSNGCNAGYTSTTRMVDQETVANPALIQVFSAGNDGGDDCGYGAGGDWGNITGGHKAAKNCIATANLVDNDAVVSSSSRGPSADGRIKPDISAYGNGQISNAPDNLYMTGSGTSAAAPGVAGTLAVLYEGWRSLNGSDPNSGLMKALLLNTADDLGNEGPDYTFGWGRLNAARTWQAIIDERYESGSVDQGQLQLHTIQVPPGVSEVRVMLYWMDPEGSLQSQTALVNDLDLEAFDPAQVLHRPWQLGTDPVASVLAAPAVRGEDHLNNVEQVTAANPGAGTWTFSVTGTNVPSGPQAYFLVHDFIFDGPVITYPLPGDVLSTFGSHRLRWDAHGNTAPFTVSLSIDSGATWSTYPPLPVERRYYDLNTGGVQVDHAFVRVERNGLTDESGPFAILPVADDLQVTFNCVDSARLAWPPVTGSAGYIVHKLGAQYMDSVGFTTDTSYVFQGLQAAHNDWFAVTNVAQNGTRAQRSLAIARPQMLFNCQAPRDLMVRSVMAPTSLVVQCQLERPVSMYIANAGLDTVQDLVVGHRLNGGNASIATLSQSLAPGDSLLYTFQDPLVGLVPDAVSSLQVWASALNESFPPNDTLTMDVLSAIDGTALPFLETGEGLTPCATTVSCAIACDDVGLLFNGRNAIDDDIDWRVDTAGTSTSGTGPSVDHTVGTVDGRYFYLEASGNCTDKQADLYTPCVLLPVIGAEALTYWYHMQGSDQGSLHVDLFVEGVLLQDVVPPVTGDQGDQWLQGVVDLSGHAGLTVSARFRGITGSGALSDLALDDIGFEPATGIRDNALSSGIQVLPTEVEGVYILAPAEPLPSSATLSVFDATGRCVLRTGTGTQTRPRIDLSGAAPGVYAVHLSAGGKAYQALLVRP